MAAIDKLYCKSYYDYRCFKLWCLIYYPKLLLYFYNIDLTYEKFDQYMDNYVDNCIQHAKRCYANLGDFETIDEAKKNYYQHYLNQGYDCPAEQVDEEVNLILEEHEYTKEDWEDKFSIAIMNCPSNIDKILKWRCPLKFVREYLQKQCGVNPKYEWFYKLFWKGKKEFI